ncbi:MAG: hypothetical protein WAP23_01810, partial [Candidatus Spechtbacterales bacterium]
AKIWDKYVETPNTLTEVLAQPLIFLCLPTPYSKRQKMGVYRGADISAIEENLAKFPRGRIAVIKSTVPPGATTYLAKKFPKIKILFNPEFLTAAYAKEDFAFPDKQILGYTNPQTKKIAEKIMPILPRAQSLILPAVEAEIIKYMLNTYYAHKVVFANQIYDICQKVGADYTRVKLGFTYDKRINDSHFDVWHGGFRGYAGACLPKDTKTFIQFAQDLGIDLKLHKTVDRLNEQLLRNGKKSQA